MRTDHDNVCMWWNDWHSCSCGYLEEEARKVAYDEKLSECHAYKLCIMGHEYPFPCKTCPQARKEG